MHHPKEDFCLLVCTLQRELKQKGGFYYESIGVSHRPLPPPSTSPSLAPRPGKPPRAQDSSLCPRSAPAGLCALPSSFPHLCFSSSSDSCMCSCSVTQLRPALCDPVDCSPPGSSVHVDSPGKNTGIGCHALLQGTVPTQRSNPCLLWFLHCRQSLYC